MTSGGKPVTKTGQHVPLSEHERVGVAKQPKQSADDRPDQGVLRDHTVAGHRGTKLLPEAAEEARPEQRSDEQQDQSAPTDVVRRVQISNGAESSGRCHIDVHAKQRKHEPEQPTGPLSPLDTHDTFSLHSFLLVLA